MLRGDDHSGGTMVWYPDELSIVLGQSNNVEQSIHPEAVIRDNIPVFRRPSGGEAVILSPNTLVISAILNESGFRSPLIYFSYFNQRVIESLKSLGVERIGYRGMSDIAIGDRKILGSSIYRSRRKIFYHAVLNVAMPAGMIETYLTHPPGEPDYRKGRPHNQFVTSLYAEGYKYDREVVGKAVTNGLTRPGLKIEGIEGIEGDTVRTASPPGNSTIVNVAEMFLKSKGADR